LLLVEGDQALGAALAQEMGGIEFARTDRAAEGTLQRLFGRDGSLTGHQGGNFGILPQGKNCRLGLLRADDKPARLRPADGVGIVAEPVILTVALDQGEPGLVDELEQTGCRRTL